MKTQSVPPVHGPVLPCWPLLMGAPAHSWRQSRQAAPSARAWTHEADTAVRCRLVQLIAPSLLWRPPLQNPCRTTTPDNSSKRDGRSNILHIYCTTSVIFAVEILPTPLPFSSQPPPVTVKDQPYEVLRLLNAFQLGSSSIHWVKRLSWKSLESRYKHTVYCLFHNVSFNHLISSPKGHNRRFKKENIKSLVPRLASSYKLLCRTIPTFESTWKTYAGISCILEASGQAHNWSYSSCSL